MDDVTRFAYKGKRPSRSWALLPSMVINLVAEDVARAEMWIPSSWDNRRGELGPKVTWMFIKMSRTLARLQGVCVSWDTALRENHMWLLIAKCFDPQERHPIWTRTRTSHTNKMRHDAVVLHILNSSCLVCRMNYCQDSTGVDVSDRQEEFLEHGVLGLCRNHQSHQFCHICLRDGYPPVGSHPVDEFGLWTAVGLRTDLQRMEQHTLCASCRSEMAHKTLDQAFGEHRGAKVAGRHVLAHQYMNCFLHDGRGTTGALRKRLEECYWMEDHTHLVGELMQTIRKIQEQENSGAITTQDARHLQDELLHPRRLHQMRSEQLDALCLYHFMKGIWVSPHDIEEHAETCRSLADILPQAWKNPLRPGNPDPLNPPPLPTYDMKAEMHTLFCKVIARVLRPALINCARRLLAECQAKGTDPAAAVFHMDLPKLLSENYLLNPAVWSVDYDFARDFPSPSISPKSSLSTVSVHSATSSRDGRSSVVDKGSPIGTEETTPSPSNKTQPLPATEDGSDPTVLETASSPLLEMASAKSHKAAGPSSGPPRSRIPGFKPLAFVPFVPTDERLVSEAAKVVIVSMWEDVVSPIYHCKCQICLRSQTPDMSDRLSMDSELDPDDSKFFDDEDFYTDSIGSDIDERRLQNQNQPGSEDEFWSDVIADDEDDAVNPASKTTPLTPEITPPRTPPNRMQESQTFTPSKRKSKDTDDVFASDNQGRTGKRLRATPEEE